jgi:hypothetical protein
MAMAVMLIATATANPIARTRRVIPPPPADPDIGSPGPLLGADGADQQRAEAAAAGHGVAPNRAMVETLTR